MTTIEQTLSSTTKLIADEFNKAFNNAADIEFNPNWANGTSYYNGAVAGKFAPKLQAGEVRRCTSTMPNNRKILLIGTPVGNVVVFQRYTDDESVFVSNMPMIVEKLTGTHSAIELHQMHQLVGKYNIGWHLEQFLEEAKEFQMENNQQ